MSGFSPDWLSLREPADLAARSRQVLTACGRAFEDLDEISICDLGAGTGASVRALADLLPRRQHWTLVDSDESNLGIALQLLARWAHSVQGYDGGLILKRDDRTLYIRTLVRDLVATPACWPKDTNLVTASALFDLTSRAWLKQLVAALSQQSLPLLSMLTFDGQISAEPSHPLDETIADAFRRHQGRDKGFGPAAGPDASAVLEEALSDAGYSIESGDSPWAIDRNASALLYATLAGIASAAHEMNSIAPTDVEHWLRSSVINTRLLTIGHRDVFAWRPSAK